MGRWRRRRSAYYGANHGNEYSKSARASEAESNGRYPRTRAASVLGVSAKAFKAGCDNAGYHSTEWHHVGKYANMVDYYDTNELAINPEFWRGCASAYKSKKKQSELNGKAESCTAEKEQTAVEKEGQKQSESCSTAHCQSSDSKASEERLEQKSSPSCLTGCDRETQTVSESDLVMA